jgi:hypothetical protein
MIELAVFDLDGTLMGEDQVISPRVRRTLAEAQSQGVIVTLATGRMFSATAPFAQSLNIEAPLLCYQGAWIQALGDPKPRYRISLPLAITYETLALADEAGWHTVFYADGYIFLRELRYEESFYEALLGENFEIVKTWETVIRRHQPDKILFVGDPAEIPAMGQRLHTHLGGRAEIVQSHAQFVEVGPRNANKGTGLAWLAEQLDIPRAAVMAAGDQENDLAMVRWAGVGVAMGNAAPKVKRAATWIAPPVEEDGAAVALERFALES